MYSNTMPKVTEETKAYIHGRTAAKLPITAICTMHEILLSIGTFNDE